MALVFFLAVAFIGWIIWLIYTNKTHSGWLEGSHPSMAETVTVTHEIEKRTGADYRISYRDASGFNQIKGYGYRVTFNFSDGFYYSPSDYLILPDGYDGKMITPSDSFYSQFVPFLNKALGEHLKALLAFHGKTLEEFANDIKEKSDS